MAWDAETSPAFEPVARARIQFAIDRELNGIAENGQRSLIGRELK